MTTAAARKAWDTRRFRWAHELGWMDVAADQDISFDVQAFDADTRTEGERIAAEEERIRCEGSAFYQLVTVTGIRTKSKKRIEKRRSMRGRSIRRWAR